MRIFTAGKKPLQSGADSSVGARRSPPSRKRISGNVFFALFAAVAMVGAVGYGFNSVLRGPIKGMTDVTKRTVAESTVVTASRLAIVGATTQQATADCDTDNYVEPLPYVDAGTAPHPTGGGYIPDKLLPDSKDPWSMTYGYCAWDSGTKILDSSCGVGAKRLAGAPNNKQVAIAIISAGKDRIFQTSCNAFVDGNADGRPDTPMVNRPAGSDDIFLSYSYAEANDLGAGMWKLKSSDTGTAETRNALEGTGSATFTNGVVLQGNTDTGGGLLLPTDASTGACDSVNNHQLRRNVSVSPPVVEICDFTNGLGWSAISGSGGGGGGGGGGADDGSSTATINGILVSRWKLDESSGTTAMDVNGLNNGVLWNAPTWSPTGGMDGGALAVTYAGDNYVKVPRSASLEPTAVTVMAWIKPGTTQNGFAGIIAKEYGDNATLPYISYAIGYDQGATELNAFVGTASGFVSVPANGPIAPDKWTHVAMTFDPTLPFEQLKLYVDGQCCASEDVNGSIAYDTTDGGNLLIGSVGPTARSFNGSIDDARVYNFALSEAQIGAIYNASAPAKFRNTKSEKIGRAVGWGTDANGSLGIDTASASLEGPVPVIGATDFVQISMGNNYACGVKAGGSVWCWGSPTSGRLGLSGVTADQLIPVHVPSLYDIVKVAAGDTHTCAIDRYGKAYCWGAGAKGQLGDGGTADRDYRIEAALEFEDFTDIAVSNLASCGLRYNGTVYCWGDGSTNKMGDGSTSDNMTAGPVSNVTDFVSISSQYGSGSFCGVTKRGLAYCWGTESTGNMGNGASGSSNVPSQISTITDFVDVKVSQNFGCGVRANGQIVCWGDDTNGRLGNGASVTAQQDAPYAIDSTYRDFIKVAVGQTFACGLRKNGEVWCWGADGSGQLGNGAIITPTQVSPSQAKIANVVDISAAGSSVLALMGSKVVIAATNDIGRDKMSTGNATSCGIDQDGSAWCWGMDNLNQLGNGAGTTSMHTPSKVSDAGPWLRITGNQSATTTCGIKTDGFAYCWGNDANGESGNGATGSTNVPGLVSGTGQWATISTSYHTCGVKSDGTGWCWGPGSNGELGNNGTSQQNSPVAVSGGYKWKMISAGGYHSCGITDKGDAYCWGDPSNGALGNGVTTGTFKVPQKVLEPGPWAMVSAGIQHTCAVKLDGSAWCWGFGGSGRVGNAPKTGAYTLPQLIYEPGPWVSVSAGIYHSCGIKLDGSAWCWGLGTDGELGIGAAVSNSYPAKVLGGSYIGIVAGAYTSCANKADGTMWCWGDDTAGKLGNGAAVTAAQVSPSKVLFMSHHNPWAINSAETAAGLLPDLNATIGTTRYMSHDGAGSYGFNLLGSGRAQLKDTTQPEQLLIEATGADNASQLSWKAASATGGSCSYVPNAVTFDGTDYTEGTVGAGASTDTDKFTMSFWFRIDPTSTRDNMYVYQGEYNAGRVQIGLHDNFDGVDGNGLWQLRVALRASDNTWLTVADGSLVRTNETITAGTWHHALISADTTNSLINLYVDDVENVRNNIKTMNVGTIDFSATQGLANVASTDRFTGDLADVWIDVGSYIDFSQTTNRRKFINTDLSPVYLGATGNLPTGSAPDMFFSGATSTWNTNDGTAGGIAMGAGTLTSAASQPPVGTMACTGALTRSMGLDYLTGNFEIARSGSNTGASADCAGLGSSYINDTTSGHCYYRVTTPKANFATAQASCVANGAYLATITSSRENALLSGWVDPNSSSDSTLINWIGGQDAAVEGTWRWVSGPETGTQFSSGATAVGGAYTYWGSIDPNGGAAENCLGYGWSGNSPGEMWYDQDCTGLKYYICEKSNYINSWMGSLTPDVEIAGNGDTGIGTTGSPQAKLDVNGAIKVGNDAASCSASKAGTIRWTGTTLDYCNGSAWVSFGSASNYYATGYANIAAGAFSTCGIRADGSLWCWGDSTNGKLGDNQDSTDRLTPVKVYDSASSTGWNDWKAVTVGQVHACGLRGDGSAWCWGQANVLGENQSTTDRYRPVKVQDSASPTGWNDWTQISSGIVHNCGLRSNGQVWCWGQPWEGQLGNNDTATVALRPVQVLSDTGGAGWSDWVFISSGYRGSCGIRIDGSAWCWGLGTTGRLGNNQNASNYALPVRVHDDVSSTGWSDWIYIATGRYHSCGIRTPGTLWCWGSAANGKIGDNQTAADRLRPVKVWDTTTSTGFTDWKQVAVFDDSTCGLRANGQAYCWGSATNGELGNNQSSTDATKPVLVHDSASSTGWTDWTAISKGSTHVCGTRTNGSMWCWGAPGDGRLGDNQTSTDRLRPVAVQ